MRQYQAMELDAKIRYANRLIEAGLELADMPCVAWSGGKDSTVMLHLVRQFDPDIVVLFNDTKVEFPETLKFVRRVSKEWGLNLHVAKPERGKDFWWCVEQYGWPLFGKAAARRTTNLPERYAKVRSSGVRITAQCCYWLKEKPSLRVYRALGIDVLFLGLMASESRLRLFQWCRTGDLYWNKEKGLWHVLPLAVWTDEDIWEYHRRHDLPLCELYAMGHRRNGCWPCGMGIGFPDNHLALLRRTHPKLWRFLMIDKGLARELLKVKLALDDGQMNLFAATWDIEALLRQRPCFFDRL